ncbi:carboxypeptidase-like regulatory domain-containing protein [Amycolatopsis thermalba]|uniref:alpha-amylase n=1 Tax=Amycolatopsis thermalba TaxID=944492 RepID=A0ABY4NUY0_9PSEU|nr:MULTISPECIES: carboxypeptidase-like regulatory domain-containing protein [Amycolatopsis]UQS23823.1 carboxypeptidase-like regulatory domain-containing protein [Amycolatopsis thermalba]
MTTTAEVTLTGRVSSGRRPLPEVTLTLTDRVGAQVSRARTGADGSFRLGGLAPGTYVLIVSRAGFQPHATVVTLEAGPAAPLDVTLEPATSVRGVVRDRHSGQPVATAAVTAVGPGGDVIASTVSDPDGGYRLTGLDAGEITLVAAAPGADPAATVVPLGGGREHVADLVLDTHSTLTGTVTADGRPVAGLALELRDASGRRVAGTVTGADGTYRFERVTGGQYTLTSTTGRPAVTTIAAGADSADLVLERP